MIGKIALAMILALLFVWSLPDTEALRHLLLFSSLLLLAWLTPWQGLGAIWQANRWPLVLLGMFTAWLLVQAIFVADDTWWSLQELKGQWLKALLAIAVGMLLARAAQAGKVVHRTGITAAMTVVLFLQALIAVGESIAYWFSHGELLRGLVPLTGGKLEMSFILNIMLAALTVDLLFRTCHRRRFLQLPLVAVVLAVMLGLMGLYLAEARNGAIGTVFLAISAGLLYCLDAYRQKGMRGALPGVALALAVVMGLAAISYQSDSRWLVFAESAKMGWSIDSQRAWMDLDHSPLPVMKSGAVVDGSAYTRVAFIHAGLRLIGEYPWGVGYGRNAFSHALREAGENAHVGHAHSGWIDLGLGGGIPAMALWLLFLGSLIGLGGGRYFHRQNPHGLWLFFLASGYMGRMLLDSVNRDHMVQMFLFLAGYLLVMSMQDGPARSQSNG
jgi:hypothetical protein